MAPDVTVDVQLCSVRDPPKTAFGFQCLSRSAIPVFGQVDSSSGIRVCISYLTSYEYIVYRIHIIYVFLQILYFIFFLIYPLI